MDEELEESDTDNKDLEIEEILSSYEYTQGEIYYRNKKYLKALNLLDSLSQTLKINQPHSKPYIFLQKRRYACLVKLNRPKDAEILLRNVIEL